MFKKSVCTLIAAVLMICQAPFVFADTAAGITEGTQQPDTIFENTAGERISYFDYSQLHSKADKNVGKIELDISDADAEIKKDYLGNEAAEISGDKTVEWKFTVPADGLYVLDILYAAAESENDRNYNLEIKLDGEIPFSAASNVILRRLWADDGIITQDSLKNDINPVIKELFEWQHCKVADNNGYSVKPCKWFLSKGEHEIKLKTEEIPLYIGGISFEPEKKLPDYKSVYSEYKKKGYKVKNTAFLTYQAEKTYNKSSQNIFPISDRNSAATVPNSPYSIKRNTIGGEYWKTGGEHISYKIDVPSDGFYSLTFKFRQNSQLDMSVYRQISINGEVPFEELVNVAFPYNSDWQNLTLSDGGKPMLIPLEKGTNTITLTVTAGEWEEVLQQVEIISAKLNTIYRRIIMVTGTTPDSYRDYYLENEIKGLKNTLKELSGELYSVAAKFDKINRQKSSQSSMLRTAADQLKEFSEKTASIPKQLKTFRENITALSDWMQNNKLQPLELDYFVLHGPDAELASPNGTFIERLSFGFKQFIASFSRDYGNVFEESEKSKSIKVWINDGRDQAQLWKDLITEGFTAEYNIGVNINLVNIGITESVLAGRAPDVMVGVARGQPVNLASRKALYDLSEFDDLKEIKKRFADDALLPYSYNGGVYALPMTQHFLMMFLRKDIFKELSLEIPQTWNEFMDVAALLQRNNLKVGLPYTAISAVGAVDLGVGAKDIFPSLLLQNGGQYYSNDLRHSRLDSEEALNAFKMWTSFYTDYGFDLSYDFVSLFRSGEMPIAIAGFPMYGMIEAVATEIHGNWEMALPPGTVGKEGNINRAGSASGSSVIMLADAEEPEACWDFMKWITSADVQSVFGNKIEGMLGVAARYTTANLEAFRKLYWTTDEHKLLEKQRKFIKETPEIPGSYYTSRCVDNAFRNVVYERKNARKSLEEQYKILETEIRRKIKELQ